MLLALGFDGITVSSTASIQPLDKLSRWSQLVIEKVHQNTESWPKSAFVGLATHNLGDAPMSHYTDALLQRSKPPSSGAGEQGKPRAKRPRDEGCERFALRTD